MASFTGTQFFNNRYTTSQASNLTVSFTGKDQNFWAGYYGPRVHVDDVSLLYTIDPCKLNPAYSSTCVGFSDVINTNNLFNTTLGGNFLTQAIAINTALENAGTGAKVHGFNYGFDYRIGQSFSGCTATNQDGSCSWYMNIPAYVNASASLTNSSNQLLYQQNYSFTGDGTTGSVSEKFLLPSSVNQTTLGTAKITGNASGPGSSIQGFWGTIIYTADPCVANPLYSPDCKNFALAMAKKIQVASTTDTTAPYDPANPASVDNGSLPPPPPPPSSGPPPPPGSPPPPPGSGPAPAPSPSQSPAPSTSPSSGSPPPPGNPPPPGSGPAPAGKETAVAQTQTQTQTQSGGASGGSNVSLALSVIAKNKDREDATASAAVQNAINEAQSASSNAERQALNIATSSSNASIAIAQEAAVTQTTSAQSNTSATSFQNLALTQSSIQTSVNTVASMTSQQSSGQQSSSLTTMNRVNDTVQQATVSMGQSQPVMNSQSVTQTQQQQNQSIVNVQGPVQVQQQQTNTMLNTTTGAVAVVQPTQQQQSSQQVQASSSVFTAIRPVEVENTMFVSNFLTNRANPMTAIVENNTRVDTSDRNEQQTSTVKTNIQPNDLAGSVNIASMAVVPAGYNLYTGLVLKDVAFYAPKEIYRNQKNVDNIRLLRQLASDAKHQQMVNLQYGEKQ
jgi:hypothetical protein